MEPSSKKKLLAVTIAFSVMAFASIAYFLVAPEKEITAENKPAATTPQLKSFRGVLASTLLDAKEEAVKIGEKIGEAVSNPFASTQNDSSQKTSSETSGENSFSFAILGDTQRFDAGNPQGNFQKAMASITKLNPDLVLAVGDLVEGCDGDNKCSKKYSDWKKIVGSLLPNTYAMQGNHDRTGDDKTDDVWRSSFSFPTNGPSGFSEQVYSFDHKNSHFVVLDSDKPKEHLVNGEERSWLEKDLSANKKENTFVFFHEPAYPVSSKITESLDKEPTERNALWEILDRHNVTAVFNGHEHIVSRRKIDGIYQFVFANTDSFNHDLPKSGIAEYASQIQGSSGLVKVDGGEITVETHAPSGTLLNSFTFSK
ncbi:MAG: metallophosphoesterase [Candidatus Moranbacteria bacterium]|nr:metallophosphoesterase [Candidatus Moranbacteria bacterium]